MQEDKIRSLIEKYFDGTTSLQEEQVLRNYFQSETVDAEFESYKSIFQYFAGERKTQIQEAPAPNAFEKRVSSSWIRWSAVAAVACFLLAFSIGLFHKQGNSAPASAVYIDGKKYTDILSIRSELLSVLDDMAAESESVFSGQLELLNDLSY